ncbi:sensor histidine kinase [Motilimonas sp. KMU-193]|uniref:sensor histidine kinase n=1 Tax=Motilimonas sp. KMU-193 TaxID=3388668 RepID=UPI00396B43F1
MKNKPPYSIKRQLTWSVGIIVSLLLLISLYGSIEFAKHEIGEVYDARLGQSAKLMLVTAASLTKHSSLEEQRQLFTQWMQHIKLLAGDEDDTATQFGHPYEQHLIFQLYQNGQLLWSSLPQLSALSLSKESHGYHNIERADGAWRTFQLALPEESASSYYIVVAEKQNVRQELIDEIAFSTSIELLLLLPTLVLVLFWLIDKYFRPIDELRVAIKQRSANRLERIYVKDSTTELEPLVQALNNLLEKLEMAWQREKRFTRAAAHELKTPLTILRLDIENALQSAIEGHSPEQLRSDLTHSLKGIERTNRLINQLLTLAKVEGVNEHHFAKVELAPLLQSVIADLVPLALKQKQEISLNAQDASIQGNKMLLEVLFRNLIDNAIRYSGIGSEIQISLEPQHNQVQIQFCDSGSEIPAATRERMFEPFYRGHTETGDGAGLGMSICQDIVTIHGGTLRLKTRTNNTNIFVVILPCA